MSVKCCPSGPVSFICLSMHISLHILSVLLSILCNLSAACVLCNFSPCALFGEFLTGSSNIWTSACGLNHVFKGIRPIEGPKTSQKVH